MIWQYALPLTNLPISLPGFLLLKPSQAKEADFFYTSRAGAREWCLPHKPSHLFRSRLDSHASRKYRLDLSWFF